MVSNLQGQDLLGSLADDQHEAESSRNQLLDCVDIPSFQQLIECAAVSQPEDGDRSLRRVKLLTYLNRLHQQFAAC